MSILYQPQGRAGEYGKWAVNLYSGGCPHKCAFCYVPAALRMTRHEWLQKPCQPRADLLKNLAKDLAKQSGKDQVFLCFTCDPYPAGIDTDLTRETIKLIHSHGWGVNILTKGGSRAIRDFDLLGPGDAFASTLTFIDPAQSREWEPGAAQPQDRFETMRLAHERGIETWASLEPVIDPAQSLEIIRLTHPFVDLVKVGRLNHHPLAASIDWHAFGWEAKRLLESLGKRYYLKDDLRKAMRMAA